MITRPRAANAVRYSDGQPRDDHGRWSGGGSSGGSSSPKEKGKAGGGKAAFTKMRLVTPLFGAPSKESLDAITKGDSVSVSNGHTITKVNVSRTTNDGLYGTTQPDSSGNGGGKKVYLPKEKVIAIDTGGSRGSGYPSHCGAPHLYLRSSIVAPASINKAARTVEVIWSTGAPVERMDLEGPFLEVLSMDPAHVDLSRLNNASVLDGHRAMSLENVLGIVSNPTVDGQRGVATVTFSRRPDVEPFFQDVAQGIVRYVSVGYSVQKWQETRAPETGARVRTAIAWTPHEISFVPTPADPGATVRSHPAMPSPRPHTAADQTPDGAEFSPCPDCATPGGCQAFGGCVIEAEELAENKNTTSPQANGGQRSAPFANHRAAEIRGIGRAAGLPDSFTSRMLNNGASVEDTRMAAFSELSGRSGGHVRTASPHVQYVGSYDAPDVQREALSLALAARLAPGLVRSHGQAQQFMGYRALDMVAELAAMRGERFNRLDQNALIQRAMHTASDFPLLLQDAGNKILLAAYANAKPTYRTWAAQRSFNDFKPHKFLRVGDFPGYQRLGDGGELKYGTMSENREQVIADEYATGIVISRKALMNDDLSALSDFSSMIAIRTAADENRMAYSMLEGSGPVLSDGKALFDAAHGNLAAPGGAISVDSVGAARAAMRKQTSLDGIRLNIEGTILVTGSDNELAARRVAASVTPVNTADVNPWAAIITPQIDANVSGARWHLFADPMLYPVVVYGYVAGTNGPQIKTETDFDSQAFKVRAGIDFGVGVIDYRGAYLNTGS